MQCWQTEKQISPRMLLQLMYAYIYLKKAKHTLVGPLPTHSQRTYQSQWNASYENYKNNPKGEHI